MFLARIDGTVTATRKHESLEGVRLLIAQRLESDGKTIGEPLIVLDWLGARLHNTVLISSDGDIARKALGNSTPSRLAVVGIVDKVGGAA